jgi:hypothetical protein
MGRLEGAWGVDEECRGFSGRREVRKGMGEREAAAGLWIVQV